MKWNTDKKIIITIIFLIITAWAIVPFLLQYLFESPEKRGLLGDSYGVLNSLFSGLAFAGVIIAILLQKSELRLQREELELTRAELTKSAKAQEASGDYLGEQSQVMKVTAELNGWAALIQARTEQINYLKQKHKDILNDMSPEIEKLDKKRNSDIESLENLMHAVLCAAEH